ncbi:hypothetical protein OQJ35_09615 [Legionella pneumophila]|nr:hypothetical protein [Legionella pneumophila]MCW8428776.1 hypothetical protein [Legionella pneumophila]
MPFTSKSGKELALAFTTDTAKKWGVVFLQRIRTPNGLGTIIGENNGNLWVWIDNDRGVTYWDHLKANVFSVDGFQPVKNASVELYPDEVVKHVENLFKCSISELIIFSQGLLSSIYTAKSDSELEDIEKNWELWLKQATEGLSAWFVSLRHYLQEHSQSPLEQMQKYGEITSRVTSIPGFTITEFNPSSLQKEINEIKEQARDLQQQKVAIIKQIPAKEDQEQIESIFKNLEQLLNDKLEQLKKLEEQNLQQKTLTSQLNKVLDNHQFAEFNLHAKKIELTVNTLLGIKPRLHDKQFMETYYVMLTMMAQYLYEQDIKEKHSEIKDKTGKEEAEDSLAPNQFTGLALAMLAGDSTIKKAYYLRLIKQLDNENTATKERPVSFDLETWANKNPVAMIALYRYLFNNTQFKQLEKDLSHKDYPLFLFEIVKLETSFILALSDTEKNNSQFSIPQEIKFHSQKVIDSLVELILDGNKETVIWLEKQIKSNKNPIVQNGKLYTALAEFYATPPHVDNEKGLFYSNQGKKITKDTEENKQSKLVFALYEAIEGVTSESRQSAVQMLKNAREYHYLKLASRKNPEAAMFCLEYCLSNNQLAETKQYAELARKADRAKAAYLEAMITKSQKGQFIPLLLEALEFGYAHAGYALTEVLVDLLERNQIEEIKEHYLNLLLKPFVLNKLPITVIIGMIIAVYADKEGTQQQEFIETWMYNLLVIAKNSEVENKTDLVVTLIKDYQGLLSDEGLLVALSILSKQRYFDNTVDPLLLDAIALIITEKDQKGPKHFFNLAIYDFLKNNTKIVVLLMNNPSSKEMLMKCEAFTNFIEKEHIPVEDTDKVKSQPSLTNLSLFGGNNNNNLPEEKDLSADASQSTIGTKKG